MNEELDVDRQERAVGQVMMLSGQGRHRETKVLARRRGLSGRSSGEITSLVWNKWILRWRT